VRETTHGGGKFLFHFTVASRTMLESIRLLVDAMPVSVRVAGAAIDVALAKSLGSKVDREPGSLRRADVNGHLPRHVTLLNEKSGNDVDDRGAVKGARFCVWR
jgi:hypothetical protein